MGASRVRYSLRHSVLVVEPLLPLSASDLPELSRSITKHIRLAQAQRAMLDARRITTRTVTSTSPVADDRAFRDALTEWAISQAEPLTLVLDDELHVAEINMASLGRGGLARAFSSTADAFRHASRGTGRPTSESGSTGKHPAVGTDERRALLFPRRPSEAAILRVTRPIDPPGSND